MIRMMLKIFLGLVIAIPLFIGAMVSLLFLEHHRTVTLPQPSGPYAVGRLTGLVEERHERQLLSPNPNDPRQAFVWVWYPADASSAAKRCDYLPADWRGVLNETRGPFNRYILSVDLAHMKDQSLCGVGISPRQQRYPLILLRAGSSALISQYTVLAENLASHGYIVLGFDAPYRSEVVVFPSGGFVKRLASNDAESLSGEKQLALARKLVAAWAADASWVLDKVTGTPIFANLRDHIDSQKIAIVGHSLGGATALQFCHDDPRCRAGVDIDGVVLGDVAKQGMDKPFLILLGGHAGENAEDVRRTLADFQVLYDHLPANTRLLATIGGANHFNFSDIGFLKSQGIQQVLQFLGVMKMDVSRQSELTSSYVRTFLDVHLKGAPAAELQKLPRN
jgi:predicted dienelactone hydrolase